MNNCGVRSFCARAWACGLVMACLLVALAVPPVMAENLGPGGGTRVIAGDQLFGPYKLFITVSPEPAQIGTVTFVVRVSDAQSGEKVRDAAVAVELVDTETGARVRGVATHADAGNPLDYAAHLAVEQPGAWDGIIQVSGPAGAAEVVFLQRVLPARQWGTLFLVAAPFVVILSVLGALWIVRSSRARPRAG